jgi:peptide deformylase
VPILEVATIPDPILNKKAAKISAIDREILQLIADMTLTLESYKGCVGIAAPQVFKSLQLVVIDVSRYSKPQPNRGRLILINPSIIKCEGFRTGREGCLSIPEFTANITRHEKILIEALNEKGERLEIPAEGFEGVVIQHEIDHLNGLLFLDRVTSIKTDVFRRKPV